jgi:hypothetical protein
MCVCERESVCLDVVVVVVVVVVVFSFVLVFHGSACLLSCCPSS